MQCKRSVVTLPDKAIFVGGREVSAQANLHRVPKCDVIENEICEIMGFVKIF